MAKKKQTRLQRAEAQAIQGLHVIAGVDRMLRDIEARLRQVEYALMRNTKVVATLLPPPRLPKKPLRDQDGRTVRMPPGITAPRPWSAARRAAARKPATARTRAAARTTRRAGGR